MPSVSYITLNVNNAEQFKRMVTAGATPNTSLYFAYGKPSPWANDASPDTPNTAISTIYDLWNIMIGGKKITGNDIRHTIPRNNWATGTVYKQYDHRDTDMFNIADP